jgi:uncharacterized metal-binding protein
MAAGRVHARAAVLTGIALTAAAVYVYQAGDATAAAGLAAGAWAGWAIDPDLDHEVRTHTERRVSRHLGSPAGRLWRAVWAPYAVLIPHRSPLSHFPGLGTVIRAAYFWAVVWILAHVLGHAIPTPPQDLALWTLAAWTVQDTVHLALDGWKMY